jgi:hypothetical protein
VKIGIIGAGRIGGGLARQLAGAGHQVLLSFSRDRAALDELAAQIGSSASTGSPPDAVAFGEVVVISVPWSVLPLALEQAGPLDGKIVIDTTNQFGGPPLPPGGQTAAQFNAGRMPGALCQVVQHADFRLPGGGGGTQPRRAGSAMAVR